MNIKDIRVGDIWRYNNRGDCTYWLIYGIKNKNTYLLCRLGEEYKTEYYIDNFVDAKSYWKLMSRPK